MKKLLICTMLIFFSSLSFSGTLPWHIQLSFDTSQIPLKGVQFFNFNYQIPWGESYINILANPNTYKSSNFSTTFNINEAYDTGNQLISNRNAIPGLVNLPSHALCDETITKSVQPWGKYVAHFVLGPKAYMSNKVYVGHYLYCTVTTKS